MKLTIFAFVACMLIQAGCSNNSNTNKTNGEINQRPESAEKEISHPMRRNNLILRTGWYYIADTDSGVKLQLDRTTDSFYISPKPIITAENILNLEIFESDAGGQKSFGVSMRLDETGTQNWNIATGKTIGHHLAFVLDNRLLQVAQVNAHISTGVAALNRGIYTKQELENFKRIIERER